jgi:hypothetical protein
MKRDGSGVRARARDQLAILKVCQRTLYSASRKSRSNCD